MVPPVILIFLVLGTIFAGWATPTEGGAMGAVGALIGCPTWSIKQRNSAWGARLNHEIGDLRHVHSVALPSLP